MRKITSKNAPSPDTVRLTAMYHFEIESVREKMETTIRQLSCIYRGLNKGGAGGAIALPYFGRIEGAAVPHYYLPTQVLGSY
jgi:hypothetical protein